MEQEKIFSVSEFITLLNIGLKRSKTKIFGEVSEVKAGPTGHIYFTLKDEKHGSVLNCIIWKFNYRISGIDLKEGMKIIAAGNPQVYAPTGRLSYIADTIQPAGEGALKKEYERLKAKLELEGIFAKKRKLPEYIHKIGIITSTKGAVIADFSNNLKKFGFEVKIVDSRVEGQEAVRDILRAIRTLKRQDIEVLVIMRGGGSLESMMAFNNEAVAREVAGFPFPVIAAIGHHKDEPLAALTADVSVSTPTSAANLINESWTKAVFLVERFQRDILIKFERSLSFDKNIIRRSVDTVYSAGNKVLKKYQIIENSFKVSLQNYKNFLFNTALFLNNSLAGFLVNFKGSIQKNTAFLASLEKIISLNNPERQLKLGYSIAFLNGKVVKSIKDVKMDNEVNIELQDGTIISKVKNINKNDKRK